MGDREGARKGEHVLAGDGLRALASLSVLLFHAVVAAVATQGPAAARDPEHAFTGARVLFHLNAGLYVFFALSGYLVGGPYARAWVTGAPWPRVGRYLSRRLRRIVPAFWLISAALIVWFGTRGSPAGQVLAIFGFVQAWDPGGVTGLIPQAWTLGTEMSFYLLLPLAGLAIGSFRAPRASERGRAGALLAVLAVAVVGGLALRTAVEPGGGVARSLPALLAAFAPGLALATIEPLVRERARGSRAWRLGALAALTAAVAAFVAIVLADAVDGELLAEVCYLLVGGGAVIGAVTLQWATGAAPRVLDNRVARALGRWSYGIYLVHVGIALELIRHMPSGLGAGGAMVWLAAWMLGLSVLIAAPLWAFVERPILRGGRGRATSPRPAPSAA